MSQPTKYYEHLITVRVLTDREIGAIGGTEDVVAALQQCYDGDFVGELVNAESREVSPILMAELLTAAGSEPSFFQIEDAQGLASELYDSSSIEGCSPDLVVVERRAFNNLMNATGLAAYVAPEEDEGGDD